MPRAQNRNRYLLAVAVAGLHLVLVLVLIEHQSRAIRSNGASATMMTVFVTMPARRPALFRAPAPLQQAPITIRIRRPVTVPAVRGVRIRLPRAINWMSAARAVAAAILAPRAKTGFGFPKGAGPLRALKGSSDDSPPRAGDSYRTDTGQRVQWVGRGCYLISGPPPLGESQLQRRSRLSRFACRSRGSASAREFFKRLSAYGRYRKRLEAAQRHTR